MKRSRMLLLALIVLVGYGGTMQAQTYSVSLTQTINGSNLDVDIMIGGASANFVPGTSSFVVNFNNAALSTPSRVNGNIGPWSSGSDFDYGLLSFSSGSDFAGLTIDFQGGDDNNGPEVTGAMQRVGTIRFVITNSSLNSGIAWSNVGTTTQVFKLSQPGVSGDQEEITGTGSFVDPGAFPLPVTLASFTALPVSDAPGVSLTWNTVSEIQNYGFFIQRRAEDASEFADLPGAFIAGKGTTTEPQSYSYTDRTATGGVWVYRLRQQDLDGASHYSEEVRVDLLTSVEESAPVVFALFQNYPNPFNPSTEIKFSVEQTGRTSLVLFNMIGQEVARLYEDVAEAGKYYRVRVDGTRLASGVYLYKLESGKQTTVKRMLLLK